MIPPYRNTVIRIGSNAIAISTDGGETFVDRDSVANYTGFYRDYKVATDTMVWTKSIANEWLLSADLVLTGHGTYGLKELGPLGMQYIYHEKDQKL